MMTYLVPLSFIESNPWQPRKKDPEGISELAENIRACAESHPETRGLLQVPAGRLISSNGDDIYKDLPIGGVDLGAWLMDNQVLVQLAFGHRRLEAFELLGYETIPVSIARYSDDEMAAMAWFENEQRRDFTPIERAVYIQRMMDDFALTQEQVAEKIKKSRPVIANMISLLSLPEEVQTGLGSGQISERQGLALKSLLDLPKDILKEANDQWNDEFKPKIILKEALNDGLSSDQIRQRADEIINRFAANLSKARWKATDEFEAEGIVSSTCKECPQRVKQKNICLDQRCYRRKERIWKERYLEEAGRILGIPADPEMASHTAINFNFGGDPDRVVRNSGCKNLRVIWCDYTSEDKDLDSHPNAMIVCKNQNGICTCLNGLKAAKNDLSTEAKPAEPVTSDELRGAASEARREKREAARIAREVSAMAANVIGQAIREWHFGAWLLLGDEVHYKLGERGDLAEGQDLDALIDAIALHLSQKMLPWEPDNSRRVLAAVNRKLHQAGLKYVIHSDVNETPEKLLNELCKCGHTYLDHVGQRCDQCECWNFKPASAPPGPPGDPEADNVLIRVGDRFGVFPYEETGYLLSDECLCGHMLVEHGPEGCSECTCEIFESVCAQTLKDGIGENDEITEEQREMMDQDQAKMETIENEKEAEKEATGEEE